MFTENPNVSSDVHHQAAFSWMDFAKPNQLQRYERTKKTQLSWTQPPGITHDQEKFTFQSAKTHAHKSSTTYAEPAPITVSHNWCKHDGKTRNEQPSSPRTALRLKQRIRSECNIPVNHTEAPARYNCSWYSHPFEERLKVL